MNSFKAIDFHIHPFVHVSPSEILSAMDNAEVEKAVLIGLDIDPTDIDIKRVRSRIEIALLNLTMGLVYIPFEELRKEAYDLMPQFRIDNEHVAKLVKLWPERFVGFGSIDVCKGKRYIERTVRKIKKLGLKGVKVLPTAQFFHPVLDRELVDLLFSLCEKEKLAVIYHTGCDVGAFELPHLSESANPILLNNILENYPNLKIILSHFGSYSAKYPKIWFKECVEIMKKYDNTYADTAAVPYILDDEKAVAKIRAEVGFERVFFGSDYPAVLFVTIKDEKELIENSSLLTAEEKELVLYENAEEFLKSL
ncbi:MAG: amidohydrolase family protein [Candidatus Jordarchaeales archaeon]